MARRRVLVATALLGAVTVLLAGVAAACDKSVGKPLVLTSKDVGPGYQCEAHASRSVPSTEKCSLESTLLGTAPAGPLPVAPEEVHEVLLGVEGEVVGLDVPDGGDGGADLVQVGPAVRAGPQVPLEPTPLPPRERALEVVGHELDRLPAHEVSTTHESHGHRP